MTTTWYLSAEVLADPKVQRLILDAAPAFQSPDPAASFDRLASSAEDDDMRFAFTHAAELLRTRDGGSRG